MSDRLDEAVEQCRELEVGEQDIEAITPILRDLCAHIDSREIVITCREQEIDRLKTENQTLKDTLIPCPNGDKAKYCLSSPDGLECACCGCVEMVAKVRRLDAENAALRADRDKPPGEREYCAGCSLVDGE